jgi:hypothetical protein
VSLAHLGHVPSSQSYTIDTQRLGVYELDHVDGFANLHDHVVLVVHAQLIEEAFLGDECAFLAEHVDIVPNELVFVLAADEDSAHDDFLESLYEKVGVLQLLVSVIPAFRVQWFEKLKYPLQRSSVCVELFESNLLGNDLLELSTIY